MPRRRRRDRSRQRSPCEPSGPGRIGCRTFVAMRTSSRLAKSFSAPPKISSLEPYEYMFAVSKKLMPASTACLMRGRLSSSASDHGGSRGPARRRLCSRGRWRDVEAGVAELDVAHGALLIQQYQASLRVHVSAIWTESNYTLGRRSALGRRRTRPRSLADAALTVPVRGAPRPRASPRRARLPDGRSGSAYLTPR